LNRHGEAGAGGTWCRARRGRSDWFHTGYLTPHIEFSKHPTPNLKVAILQKIAEKNADFNRALPYQDCACLRSIFACILHAFACGIGRKKSWAAAPQIEIS
jgi:hypothetical protein